MPFQSPSSGQGNIAEYLMSALPYVTASSVTSGTVGQINFPYLTKNITVRNAGASILAVGFSRSGTLGSNRLTLPPSASFSADFRIRSLFLMGFDGGTNFELVAGLTTIDPKHFPILTGSATQVSSSQYDPYFSYEGVG